MRCLGESFRRARVSIAGLNGANGRLKAGAVSLRLEARTWLALEEKSYVFT
jgi:hypothetical protein